MTKQKDTLHNALVLIRCSKSSHKNCKPVRNAVMKNFKNVLQSYTTHAEMEGTEYCVASKAIVKDSELKKFTAKMQKLQTGTAARPVTVSKLRVLVTN